MYVRAAVTFPKLLYMYIQWGLSNPDTSPGCFYTKELNFYTVKPEIHVPDGQF